MGGAVRKKGIDPECRGYASAQPAPKAGQRASPSGDSREHPASLDGVTATPGPATLLRLQGIAGNAAVSALVLQRQTRPTASPPSDLPNWSDAELAAIQRELKRLRLYNLRIDHVFGPGTEAGLVEAFGGDGWRRQEPVAIVSALRAATTPPRSPRPAHQLRYGELFKDGVLDLTVGIGYTEEMTDDGRQQYYLSLLPQFRHSLVDERGFLSDQAAAVAILVRAGRAIGATPAGEFFVKRRALTYRPPAGAERSIDVVVHVVANTTGDSAGGAAAAGAFTEGLERSDVAYYTGHGRYGSGPDFDRNFDHFELLDSSGAITRTFAGKDYEVLGEYLRREGASGRTAWEQFLYRDRQHRINVLTSDLGNVYLNPRRLENEFGAKLIYWALQRDGRVPVTGPAGELGRGAAAVPEHRYHVEVFDGCRTRDYERSIQSTPGFGPGQADIFSTTRLTGFKAEAATFAAFLDAIIGEQSAEEIVLGMDTALAAHEEGGDGSHAFHAAGLRNDPIR